MAGRRQSKIDELDEKRKNQGLKIRSPKNRRPYGLLSKVGIPSAGLTPGEAWDTWNDYQKGLRENQKPKKPTVNSFINPQESKQATIRLQVNASVKSPAKSTVNRIKI